jgi:hypothetical protein
MCFGVRGLSADALMKLMVWHYVCDALKITIAVILMLSSHCCYCGDFSAVSWILQGLASCVILEIWNLHSAL